MREYRSSFARVQARAKVGVQIRLCLTELSCGNRSEAFAFRIAMIRLFTALEIPELIRSQLTALQSGPLGVRWIAPENFHVTVAFVGEIDERAAHVLDGELRDVRAPGFEIELKGAGEFGGRKPHSLWARVEPNAALTNLFERHQAAMRRAGLAPESRRYVPHVTLGRAKELTPEAAQRWIALNNLFASGPFPVERVVLFSSHPTKNGAHYEPERVYPLGPTRL